MDPRDRLELRQRAEQELTGWLRRYGSLGYGECMAMMDIVFVALYEAWRERREALLAAGAAAHDADPE